MSATNPQMSVPLSKPVDFCGHFPYQLGLSFCGSPQLYASKPVDVCKSLRKILTLFFFAADILKRLGIEINCICPHKLLRTSADF